MVPTVSVDSCGRLSPSSTPTKPYTADTVTMPAANAPSGRSNARSASACRLAPAWLIGPIDAAIAMLHAVNVPANPETNANTRPAPLPAIGVDFASWPSNVFATLAPITLSTSS